MDHREYLTTRLNADRKKTSRREEFTLRTIESCFLDLLAKKPIEKISVAELCALADVNRSTFYRHFEDLYALLDAITNRCHRDMFYNVVETVSFDQDFEELGYNYILRVCEITESQKERYQLLLFGKTPTNLLQLLAESSYKLYVMAHTEQSGFKSRPETELHYRYLIHGMLGVWTNWIREGCAWPKETVARVVKEQISGFFGNMHRLYDSADEH